MRSIKLLLSSVLVLASLSLFLVVFAPQLAASRIGKMFVHQDPDLPPGRDGEVDKEEYLEQRNEWVMMKRGLDSKFPVDPARAREVAITQMTGQLRELEAQRLSRAGENPEVSTTAWTPVGPAPAPVTPAEGPVTGIVVSIAVHPTNPSIVFVGTGSGGLYRTLNGQAANPTWTPMFDTVQLQSVGASAIGTLAIGAIAFAPSNPDIVYIGTGSPNGSFGSGLYRIEGATTASPTIVGPINPAADYGNGVLTAFKYTAISKILVHPTQPNVIFVSTTVGNAGLITHNFSPRPPFDGEATHGIYRSTNGTDAANAVTFTRQGPPTDDSYVTDMVFDPSDSSANTLLAWVLSPGGPDASGVWRTTNALSGNPATYTRTLVAEGRVNGKLAINQVGGVVTVLAGTGEAPAAPNPNGCTTQGRLRRSVDGGVTWPSADSTASNQGGWIRAADGFCGGQCIHDLAVAMAPGDARMIQLGGQYDDGCRILSKRSVDGVTFTRNDLGLHADVQVLTVAPSAPNIVWFGSDGGVWRSSDTGASWLDMNGDLATNNNPAGKINAMQYVSIATHPTDREYMTGGTQDNGTHLKRAATNGGLWDRIAFGDGGYTAIDTNATDTTNVRIYHTYFRAEYEYVTSTADAVALNWTNRRCVPGGAGNTRLDCNDSTLFYPPMVLGPGNPNTLYFGTDRLYRSSDGGDTIQLVSQGPIATQSAGPQITSISVALGNDNVRLVGLRDGRVWATTTGSNTLVEVTPPDVYVGADLVGRVMIDPNTSNPNAITAYVAYGNFSWPANPFMVPPNHVTHLYKTTNLAGGASTWVDMSNGLPDIPVNAMAIDRMSAQAPNPATTLYLGTDIGVYRSTNGGANWEIYNPGNTLPVLPVFDMAFQEQGGVGNRILRIATYGRGIWEIQTTGTGGPVSLIGAVSRKVHGGAGTYDIDLVNGASKVECRSGGNYTLVLSFPNTLSTVSGASVTSGVGSVSSSAIDANDAHNYIVNLSGVTNAQIISVSLSNVSDTAGNNSSSVPISMSVLLGDINSSGSVNGTDVGQAKAGASTGTVNGSNFRADVNVSGSINATDVGIAKSQSGQSLP